VTQTLADTPTDAIPIVEGDPRLDDARPPRAHTHDALYAALNHAHAGGSTVPTGAIVMWSGTVASIPQGWVLCDGQNGTPDLRDRFIRGAAAGQNPGATGGSLTHTHADHATHTHTYTQVPNHVHVQSVNSAATGGLSGYTADTSTNNGVASGYSTQNPTGGVATGTTNANAAQAHDTPSHLPPFFSLCFVMKT
jgi:microcystin-dependent protein